MKRRDFSVVLKAEIKRHGRMCYITEISIPARSIEQAAEIRRPFINAIIRACKKRRRRG